jgi:hypothetical protein
MASWRETLQRTKDASKATAAARIRERLARLLPLRVLRTRRTRYLMWKKAL